ncbi:unnamed protein product [Polarella glacialis]|uniref:Uncharacterized protein n=1 Tax=Polarella glacialis TaxID=89957 RepID=A0A813GTI8_POLGL|nr:unnamed protein product [Polarella glacialis]CAE8627735.1 unnamed protein product [Polarella glacialis]
MAVLAADKGNDGTMVASGIWESLIEVSPLLGQCRLLVRQISPPGRQGCPPDHRNWSAGLRIAEGGKLRLFLAPQGTQLSAGEQCADTIMLQLGDGVEAQSDCLRQHDDHLCVTLSVSTESKWLSRLMQPWGQDLPQASLELVCRSCQQQLLRSRPPEDAHLEALLLPTDVWQACAEVAACEECSPMGGGHVQAQPGRVFVSDQCFLVCAADLDETSLARGTDGLVRCHCGLTIGEWQPPVSQKDLREEKRGKLGLNLCRESWRRGAACRAAGISLYKHRISLPTSQEGDSPCDLLEDFLEEASVGAHLLALRANQGHSRFRLLPGHPDGSPAPRPSSEESPSATEASESYEALEVRIVVPEMLLIGPQSHDSGGGAASSGRARRVAKVYFRPCSCSDSSSQGCLVVIPQESFHAVCRSLNFWVANLPASHSLAPAMPRAGENQSPWRTSFLPLPPRDAAERE